MRKIYYALDEAISCCANSKLAHGHERDIKEYHKML